MTDKPQKPKAVERDERGRIIGGSLNPGGRTKIQDELMELMRAKCPRALERVFEIMESADDKVALQASNSLLDRVCGKARESVEVSGDGLSDLLRALAVAKPPPSEP